MQWFPPDRCCKKIHWKLWDSIAQSLADSQEDVPWILVRTLEDLRAVKHRTMIHEMALRFLVRFWFVDASGVLPPCASLAEMALRARVMDMGELCASSADGVEG